MSHHLDSPLARKDPRLNISDVYLFKGNSGTVLVMNVNPLSGKGGFHHEALYEFRVDKDGDAVEDLTFRVSFGENKDEHQTVTVRQLTGHDAADREAEGTVIAEGSVGENLQAQGGIQVFTGAAGEPFYVDGTVVTAAIKAVAEESAPDLAGFDLATAKNPFGNSNVCTIVLEVPNDVLGDEIGFWGTVALATDAGGWGQVQRLATPLLSSLYNVTEIHGDFDASKPADDEKNYSEFVTKKTAAVVKAMGSNDDPEAYAEKLTKQLLPDTLHYQVGSEAEFSVEKRNGRGLTENAAEVMFELVFGKPVSIGLDASAATGELRDDFPYLSLPVTVKA